jgi:two-component system LytT family sensor kinase
VLLITRRRRRELETSADRATFEALHTASRAAPSLRAGVTGRGAQRAARQPLGPSTGTD